MDRHACDGAFAVIPWMLDRLHGMASRQEASDLLSSEYCTHGPKVHILLASLTSVLDTTLPGSAVPLCCTFMLLEAPSGSEYKSCPPCFVLSVRSLGGGGSLRRWSLVSLRLHVDPNCATSSFMSRTTLLALPSAFGVVRILHTKHISKPFILSFYFEDHQHDTHNHLPLHRLGRRGEQAKARIILDSYSTSCSILVLSQSVLFCFRSCACSIPSTSRLRLRNIFSLDFCSRLTGTPSIPRACLLVSSVLLGCSDGWCGENAFACHLYARKEKRREWNYGVSYDYIA